MHIIMQYIIFELTSVYKCIPPSVPHKSKAEQSSPSLLILM